MIGLWNPIVAVVLTIVGVATTNIIGLFHLNYTYLIVFIILGGIALFKLGRRS